MSKLVLRLAVVAALSLPTALAAQSTTSPVTASISALANVASVVTATAGNDLRFGDGAAANGLLPGATYTVDVTTGTGGQRGSASITHNTPVDVTVTAAQALRDATGVGLDMPFTVACGSSTDAALTLVTTTGWTNCMRNIGLTSNQRTTSYVAVGGQLVIPVEQAAGSYTGTVQFSVAFTRY